MSFDTEHWFWWLIMASVVVWYSTITLWVAFKGSFDIKHMLQNLGRADTREGTGFPVIESPRQPDSGDNAPNS